MYSIINSNSFKKDYKRIVKRNYNISLLKEIIEVLTESGHCLQYINHTNLLAIIRVVGNVT